MRPAPPIVRHADYASGEIVGADLGAAKFRVRESRSWAQDHQHGESRRRRVSSMTSAAAAGAVVLLDRDGTIIVDRDYLDDPSGLEFIAGAADGLRSLCVQGYRLVVITNQSGVGRGLFSLEQLEKIHRRLREMVRDAGADLAGIYFCPHRPEEHCGCRKPETGLVTQAVADLKFDPAAAIVIGDKASDVELGRRIRARTILIRPAADAVLAIPSGGTIQEGPPDFVAEGLDAAARLIEGLRL
jgi:histidinol-phosphate phosphatase family protein